MRHTLLSILVVSAAVVGCASQKHFVPTSKPATQTVATTRLSEAADLSLDDIQPKPVLRPTSEPATTEPAPLDAIALFAQARDAMVTGKRYSAINLLEKAIRLDPDSYELRYLLGQANNGPGMSYDPAIAAFESAAAIEDDHINVHTELGRLYLAKGNVTRAIQHLRLAAQTSDYDSDDTQGAVVDFFLAKALEQGGYDRAALECYANLITRMERGTIQPRGSPELMYLVNRPDGLFVQVGELFEKRRQYDDAIHLYSLAAEHQPTEFSYQAHVVRAMIAAGKTTEAAARSTELVEQFHASPDSLKLMAEAHRKAGGDAAVVRELQQLRKENPNDRVILYALVDLLVQMRRTSDAQALLLETVQESKYPTEMVRRLARMYDAAGDVNAGARLMIDTLAARPDAMRELLPIWVQLLRQWRSNHLTLARLQALEVPASSQASKDFWIAQLARLFGRDVLARTALEDAVKQVPPFAPAYRGLLGRYWQRDDWDEAQKKRESNALIASVEKQGDAVLAAEMRGLVLLSTKQPAAAATEFSKAIELGSPSSDLRLSYATALQAAGDGNRAQQVLWKLIQDDPTCEDAYMQLFKEYIDAQQGEQAIKVLNTWRTNDPASVNAKLLDATVRGRANQQDDAQHILDDLFASEPDNADVLTAMSDFYGSSGQMEAFIAKLEKQREAHPENRVALEQLIDVYAARKEIAQATRALDASRAAAAQDADLLYFIASLYGRVGLKEMTEQTLEQVLKVDAKHAAASNDLGYSWADAGKNLGRAETLVKTAVEAEPDNQSYLDSLGWVLYKRGKFAEARSALEEAIGTSSLPDPVVLDHLGDTLYRLNLGEEAAKQWKHSRERLAPASQANEERDELRQLRLQLQQKLKQAESGETVNVAPVADSPEARSPHAQK